MRDADAYEPGPLAAITGLNSVLLFVCKWLSITLVSLVAVIVIATVIFRYVLNNSISWSEDAAKFLMVWMAFLGAPLGFRHGAHVAIELIPSAAPRVVHRVARILVHAVVLVLMVILAWQSWLFTWNGRSQVALTIGDVSMFWIFVCMPIGAAIMAMVALELLLKALLGLPESTIAEQEMISTQGM